MWVSQKQGEAIEQTLRIALEKPRERRIERAIGEGGVNEHHPAVVRDQPVAESVHVFVLGIARHFFQTEQDILETCKIAAGDRDAAESLKKCGKQGTRFRSGFLGEG